MNDDKWDKLALYFKDRSRGAVVDGMSWNGKPGEFSEAELNTIVDHITFRNLPDDSNGEPQF